MQTVACACLNDWDGLILYNYQTSEKWDDQPADEILSVFDAYNDPAVACQWGFMASVFLKGLVAVSDKKVDVVYTQDDLKTLPNGHGMLTTMLPYITGMRNVFLDGGRGTPVTRMRPSMQAFKWSRSFRGKERSLLCMVSLQGCNEKISDKNRLTFAARDTKEIQPGIHLGEKHWFLIRLKRLQGTEITGNLQKSWIRPLRSGGLFQRMQDLWTGK